MKYILFFQLLIFFFNVSFSQDNIEVDSNTYSWYSPSLNYFQYFSKNSLSSFYDALNNSKKNKVSIIHFGDSHIQSEIPTHETRINLQKKYGNGGRGIVFPYSTAKTYSSIHYATKHTGNWIYSKSTKPTKELPKGIMGISSKTQDSSASFTITFNAKTPSNHLSVNLFCETDSLSYDIIVETDGNVIPIDVYANNKNLGYISFTIPSVSNSITFKCLKSNSFQKQFIIHGFEILNPENKGIIYYSSGLGGAKFNSLLNIENFNKQLKVISPDLVILDFGTNDFLFSDTIKESLEIDIKNVISAIRKTSPLISIVLCTTQDLYYKQKNLNSTVNYTELIKKIAKETEVAYWDWFSISGGKSSLKIWLNQGLAKSDLIHLTNAGYRIKGKLLFEAIENTKNLIEKNPNQNDLLLTQKPKNIDLTSISNQNKQNLTSLSNRELINEEKKDSIYTFSIQTDLQKQDSIKSISELDLKKESIKNAHNSEPIINQTVKDTNQILESITKNMEIKPKTNDSLTKSDPITSKPKTTSDILRTELNSQSNNTNKISTNSVNKSQITKSNSRNIKVEQTEDIIDSTINQIDIQIQKNHSKNTNKKNYEIARERQHQILDHDTLAVGIFKDSLNVKPIKKPIKKIIKPKNINYKVKNGDNLSYIAEKHNVSISNIKTWNRLKSDNLSIGQIIIIKK